MMRGLQAFCWIETALIGGYLAAVCALCRHHPKLAWTHQEDGAHVAVGWLCPQPPVAETKPEGTKAEVRPATPLGFGLSLITFARLLPVPVCPPAADAVSGR
jgi:hypothetical protein